MPKFKNKNKLSFFKRKQVNENKSISENYHSLQKQSIHTAPFELNSRETIAWN